MLYLVCRIIESKIKKIMSAKIKGGCVKYGEFRMLNMWRIQKTEKKN